MRRALSNLAYQVSAAQHSTAQHSTAQHSTARRGTARHGINGMAARQVQTQCSKPAVTAH
jgi:hypothetical protein